MSGTAVVPHQLHPPPSRIAHACGGHLKRIYNNSSAALLANIGRGFAWFEIDFIWVDGSLVTDAGRAAAVESEAASYYDAKDEGLASREALPDTKPMTLGDLSEIMKQHEDIKIVVDNKNVTKNVEAMGMLFSELPDADERVIPQIFTPEEFGPVAALGFKHIIWTLYNYEGSDADILAILPTMVNLAYVTMPLTRALTEFSKDVKKLGFVTLTHTVNDLPTMEQVKEWGIGEIYSDWLV